MRLVLPFYFPANFIPYENLLHAGLTPREHLMYVAHLRLASSVSVAEKAERVHALLGKITCVGVF